VNGAVEMGVAGRWTISLKRDQWDRRDRMG
jgi:hypothetical protein